MSKKFRCAMCGNEYTTKDESDEDAIAEAEANFGSGCMERLDMVKVCDDCYELLVAANLINKQK